MSDSTTAPASPDDEPTQEEIAAAGVIRPLDELPSPWVIKGEPNFVVSAPTIEALSEPDRRTVLERAGSTDPKAVEGALYEFLRERQRDVRMRCGAGENVSETEREALDQMNQIRLLTEEYTKLEIELADVREYRTETDADGNPQPVPVYAVQGSQRSARENRMDAIAEAMAMLAGREGELALQRATRADALRIRKVRAEVEEAREVNRRAHQIAQDRRINERAEAKAKHL